MKNIKKRMAALTVFSVVVSCLLLGTLTVSADNWLDCLYPLESEYCDPDGVPVYKYAYTYDEEENIDEELVYGYDKEKGEYVLNDKITFIYDKNGNIVSNEELYRSEETGEFYVSSTAEWTYDENGKELSVCSYAYTEDGTAVYGVKTEYVYDDKGNLLEDTSYEFIDSVWVKEERNIYERNKDGLVVTQTENKFEDGVEMFYCRTRYTYDEDGNETEEIDEYWSEDSDAYELNGKSVSEYNENGDLILRRSYVRSDGEWVLNSMGTYVYDENGNEISCTSSQAEDGKMTDISKMEYSYDASGRETVCVDYEIDEQGNLIPAFKLETTYPNGYDFYIKEYMYNEDHWDFEGTTSYIMEAQHNTVTAVDGKNPTADEDGWKKAYICRKCGRYFEDEAGKILIGSKADYNAWKLGAGKIPATGNEESPETGVTFPIGFAAVLSAVSAGVLFISSKKESKI